MTAWWCSPELAQPPAAHDRPLEQAERASPLDAVHQLTRAGNSYTIPRNRLFYCWDDLLTDVPDGIGLLRHVIELVRRLNVLEALEGLRVRDRSARHADRSCADQGADHGGRGRSLATTRTGSTPTSPRKPRTCAALWRTSSSRPRSCSTCFSTRARTRESIRTRSRRSSAGRSSSSAATRAACGTSMPRSPGCNSRSRGCSGSSSRSWARGPRARARCTPTRRRCSGCRCRRPLTEIGAFATQDLARPLVALNGLDPDTCAPTLVAEPISTDDILLVCQALQALGAAALSPDDPAIPVLRDRMSLPTAPPPTPEMMGMLELGQRGPRRGPPDSHARGGRHPR